MPKRLLDRQVSLLEHLTSAGAIFGDGTRAPPLGIDLALLRVEARFSHEKRMEKIIAVFPRTIALLAASFDSLVRDFVAACPPIDISRIVNARQFHYFLLDRWRSKPPAQSFLFDLARSEFAIAEVRVAAENGASPAQENGTGLRKRPDVFLVRSSFDIRPLFEDHSNPGAVMKRDTPLAIAWDAQAHEPRILELAPELFELLAALDEWTDPALFEGSEAAELVEALTTGGLVELRR